MRAVEDALQIQIPDNARILRNIMEGALYVQDHVVHFYHLHALDWVDIVSALLANPADTAALAQSISDWPKSSTTYFAGVQNRIKAFVGSGQLGIFANGYWGHPAYALPPAANLMAVAHYLEALDWQREIIKIHALLGGKNPHPQNYLVGGMSTPLDPNSQNAINAHRLAQLQTWAALGLEFVQKVYIPDVLAIAPFYKEWAGLGKGLGNYMAYGDFPANNTSDPGALWLPRGFITGRNIGAPPQQLDQQMVGEYITHSWYQYSDGNDASKHPWQGETQPNYTGPQPPFEFLDTDAKYSWLKAPRLNDQPMEVGPLARMLVAYTSGHQRVQEVVNLVLQTLGVGPEALFSTLGRVAARAVETLVVAEQLPTWIHDLAANIGRGDLRAHNAERWHPSSWPKEATGWGFTEAPRGALGHWVHIQDGKIANYQAVVPSTWNGSPRDARGQRGAWEEALLDTPVADPERPVEILRTIHSFDPCMACAVHVLDGRGREVTRVKVA